MSAVNVTDVHVDEDGVRARADGDVVLDVCFDGRRVWSFRLPRDGEQTGAGNRQLAWPTELHRFLHGVTRFSLVDHLRKEVIFETELRLGTSPSSSERIAVVDEGGRPLGVDKSGRLAQMFDTRTSHDVAPLLDSIEEVLRALAAAGVQAFAAYGTLLGAVRERRLIGHDSDADLAYVSAHSTPVDVVLESFALQRKLADMGYATTRYSGAAFRVGVTEADGSNRGLDVFAGFLRDGHLNLMGEVRAPFRREWVLPLATCLLEGRVLPAPANADAFLAATYGESWRVPDPAFKFSTPESTKRRLGGWFRGTRAKRTKWASIYRTHPFTPAALEPSAFARWVVEREGVATPIVDIGCGRGGDAYWMAERGAAVIGLDYVVSATREAARIAERRNLPVEFRFFNLAELRSVLGGSARIAHTPGPRIVTARHLVDTTGEIGRANLWRAVEMMLRDGGRCYVEFLVRGGRGEDFVRANLLKPLPMQQVVSELVARGAQVVHDEVQQIRNESTRGSRRIGRLVVEWNR